MSGRSQGYRAKLYHRNFSPSSSPRKIIILLWSVLIYLRHYCIKCYIHQKKAWHYCIQYCIKQKNNLESSGLATFKIIKRTCQNWTFVRPQGSLFPMWYKKPIQNQTYKLKGLFFWRSQTDGISAIPVHTAGISPRLFNWYDSLLLRAQMLSLEYPYGNHPFPHRYMQYNKNFQYTCPEAGFTSNTDNFTPK